MPIYKGSQKLGSIKKGSTLITEAYKGSQLVYRVGFDAITFTENGTWKVPAGVRQIRIDCGAPNAERSLSGAGGQGYFGGGGAVEGYYYQGSSAYGASCAAAGGGSSYTDPDLCTDVVHTQGYQAGNGYVTISMV